MTENELKRTVARLATSVKLLAQMAVYKLPEYHKVAAPKEPGDGWSVTDSSGFAIYDETCELSEFQAKLIARLLDVDDEFEWEDVAPLVELFDNVEV